MTGSGISDDQNGVMVEIIPGPNESYECHPVLTESLTNGETELGIPREGIFTRARVKSEIDMVWVEVARAHFLRCGDN